MKKIILFTNMSSINKHWTNAVSSTYEAVSIEDFNKLTSYLDSYNENIIVLFDEMSVSDIRNPLQELKNYPFANILLFHASPEVHHASTLLKEGIKGYENSYIAKENLLKMIKSVSNGDNWLFSDLTHYIVSKYIKGNCDDEPAFMSSLTDKEVSIAMMISDGLSNKEISQEKKIALSTVKGHISNIFEKAGVSDRVSLALKFK